MKKIITVFALAILIANAASATTVFSATALQIIKTAKLDIKIKNDSGEEITVINAGSGGTYRLQKNVITTIKMNAGDKLYIYESGKKGKLLLTATADMDGKVQLITKL
jgi:hypothetical protein